MSTVDQVIGAYLSLREQKEQLSRKHKDEMQPINTNMEKLEAWLSHQLTLQGLTSFKANGLGTAYTETVVTAKVDDWESTLEWIKSVGAWEFLEKRVAKSVVDDYVNAHGQVPPGISIGQEIRVRVRKA